MEEENKLWYFVDPDKLTERTDDGYDGYSDRLSDDWAKKVSSSIPQSDIDYYKYSDDYNTINNKTETYSYNYDKNKFNGQFNNNNTNSTQSLYQRYMDQFSPQNEQQYLSNNRSSFYNSLLSDQLALQKQSYEANVEHMKFLDNIAQEKLELSRKLLNKHFRAAKLNANYFRNGG